MNVKGKQLLVSTAAIVSLLVLIVPTVITATSAYGAATTEFAYAGYEPDAAELGGFWVLSVQGNFIVPKVTCSVGERSSAAYELGIDSGGGGYQYNVRNGAQVLFGCSSGSPVYLPYMFEAGSPISVAEPVSAGDKMSVKVSYTHSLSTLTCKIEICFVINLHDVTKGWTKQASVFDATAERYVAYFILVRPGSTASFPLPHFGKITTTGDYVTIGLTQASLTGTKGTLYYWSSSTNTQKIYTEVFQITLADFPTNKILATPSSLSSATTGFTIAFDSPS